MTLIEAENLWVAGKISDDQLHEAYMHEYNKAKAEASVAREAYEAALQRLEDAKEAHNAAHYEAYKLAGNQVRLNGRVVQLGVICRTLKSNGTDSLIERLRAMVKP